MTASTVTPARVARLLRDTADAFASGEIKWGTGTFYDPHTGCRCTLGGLLYMGAGWGWTYFATIEHLAQYLVAVLGEPMCVTDGQPDWVETVAGFNDSHGEPEVIDALRGAAEWEAAL